MVWIALIGPVTGSLGVWYPMDRYCNTVYHDDDGGDGIGVTTELG